MRVLAPIKEVRKLKQDLLSQHYTTLTRKVVDMTRVNTKSGVTRRVKVGVMLLRPHESILTIMASYLSNDLFVSSEKRFRKPSNIPANVKYVVLIKSAADKGGGAWNFSLNPVNVKCPQSLRHVRPICEYAADDSRDNMRAAVFYEGSPYRVDMEEVLLCGFLAVLFYWNNQKTENCVLVPVARDQGAHDYVPSISARGTALSLSHA